MSIPFIKTDDHVQLTIDENHYITGFAFVGGIVGGIDTKLTEKDMPTAYMNAYKYINGTIVLDKEKKEAMIAIEEEVLNSKPEIEVLKEDNNTLKEELEAIKRILIQSQLMPEPTEGAK